MSNFYINNLSKLWQCEITLRVLSSSPIDRIFWQDRLQPVMAKKKKKKVQIRGASSRVAWWHSEIDRLEDVCGASIHFTFEPQWLMLSVARLREIEEKKWGKSNAGYSLLYCMDSHDIIHDLEYFYEVSLLICDPWTLTDWMNRTGERITLNNLY